MKKCNHFKDLILIEYMDGRLEKNAAHQLEAHLLDCRVCRDFFKEVKTSAVLPFQQTTPQPVPAELWNSIKQSLEVEAPLNPIEEFFKGLIVFPKLVPFFATLVLLFLGGTLSLSTLQAQRAQEKDQGEYLVSLLGPGSSVAPENNDAAMPIEHYFL